MIHIALNADQTHLPIGQDYLAADYTNLTYYFGQVRDPSWPSPFAILSGGNQDDPVHQSDNLQPSLETQMRGYTYFRIDGGHTGVHLFEVGLPYIRNMRRDQSFLAFTNRSYGLNNFSSTGVFNDIGVRGWDHTTIIDETNHYFVQLTGTGTADVTLRRLQNLVHTPGTVYDVLINGSPAAQVTADQYGLVTIPMVL
ncbi:MAG: hypothetical protein A2324_18860 [Candidatus Raymondbacteria bacterium RIFOXYB2_FULL_49_35]|nr:MAG: hypothetical protein A2324_18860 [Candidatus Raymondbacteria bacterium RIFOXYB2_FULL_49_35]